MADNLPVIKANQELAGNNPASSTLLGRGLAAIQSRKSSLIFLIENQDEIYQHSRLSFNLLTDFGDRNCFGGECWQYQELEQLLSCFNSLKKLADAGYGKAYFPLYHLFQGGPSAHRNEALASHYAKLAFDWCFDNQFCSDPEVWNDLGTLYRLGAGCEMDVDLAMYWYRQAADAGNAEGMFNVSGMYEFGIGVEEDLETAHYWQVMAAEAGHAYAQYGLACQYHHGGLFEQDDELAFHWFLRSAVNGYELATIGLDELRYCVFGLELNDDVTFEWFTRKAGSGYVFAQLFLADAYKHGLGVDQDNYEAAKWLKLAAEHNDPYAQWKFGLLLWIEDSDEASYWLRKAANAGNAEAQYDLAWLLSETMELEEGEILYWLNRSGQQGYEPAIFVWDNSWIFENSNNINKSELFGLAYSWCRKNILIFNQDNQSYTGFINNKINPNYFTGDHWIEELQLQNYKYQEFYFLTSAAKLGNGEAINRMNELEIDC